VINLRKIFLNWPQRNTFKIWSCGKNVIEKIEFIYIYTNFADFFHLRWFISNSYGNENLLKLPRGEVYDMLTLKQKKRWADPEFVSKIRQVQYATFPHMWRHLGRFTSYRNNRNCSTVIEFFNTDSTENVYLVIIYKKTWYFSESKTIDVHCRGAKIYFHLLIHVIPWNMREKCKIL
jgi:hypothetical protein